MELQRDYYAEQALAENVDLERLYVELVEAVVSNQYGARIGDTGMRVLTLEGEKLKKEVRHRGFAGLSKGRWKILLGKEEMRGMNAIDAIESLIQVYGRTCLINKQSELRCALHAHRIIFPDEPGQIFLHCLAETAVNQALDRLGIGMVEMRKVHSDTDVNLVKECEAVVDMVYQKMHALLSKPT